MSYLSYEFFTQDEDERGWLVALLNESNFTGFEETAESLKAYAPEGIANKSRVEHLLQQNDLAHIRFAEEHIADKDWNEEWERNYPPIVVADRVGIRASFHPPLGTAVELLVEPKMSFGTGHHATTAAMIELMLTTDFVEKSVLDFGSGTGILSILAEKLGAQQVIAIDHEHWAYENGKETVAKNNCTRISCIYGDTSHLFTQKFDIILANINRQVIVANIGKWSELLAAGGTLFLSGILESDEKIITDETHKYFLTTDTILRNENWIAMRLHSTKNKL